MSNLSVGLSISITGRVIIIWEELLFKIIVSSDGLVIRKKVSSESSNCIETHIDVVVEVLETHISVFFDLCLGEDFIEFW